MQHLARLYGYDGSSQSSQLGGRPDLPHHRSARSQHLIRSAEDVLILTLSEFPARTKVHLGGVVMARSVKYLGRIASVKDQETRDAWWAELREEVRSHAKSLTCTHILGYSET
jgi:hypothetical protein